MWHYIHKQESFWIEKHSSHNFYFWRRSSEFILIWWLCMISFHWRLFATGSKWCSQVDWFFETRDFFELLRILSYPPSFVANPISILHTHASPTPTWSENSFTATHLSAKTKLLMRCSLLVVCAVCGLPLQGKSRILAWTH